MPYKNLIKIYSERKNKLNELLNQNVGLKQERIIAINGAVDEIGLFINILNQYQEQTIANNQKQLSESVNQMGVISKIKNSVLGYIL